MTNTARSKGLSAASRFSAAEERQRAIGAQLRQLYDDVVREPVPEEFLRLLEEAEMLEEAEKVEARTNNGGAPEDTDVE
jgi:hypothetical protein